METTAPQHDEDPAVAIERRREAAELQARLDEQEAATDAYRDAVEPASEPEVDEDFDAFWREQEAAGKRRGRRIKLMGHTVTLPPALPLQFEMEARRLQHSRQDADVHKLIAILFGAEAFDAWAEAGMDLEQFQLVLAWAPRAIAGQPVTVAEVAAELEAKRSGAEESDPS